MNTLRQFRRWTLQASRFERGRTALIAGVALVLVATALLPAPVEHADRDLRAHAATADAQGDAQGDARTGTGPTLPGEAGPGSGVGSTAGATGSTQVADRGAGPGRGGPTTGERGITNTSVKVGFTIVQDTVATALGYSAGFRGDAKDAIDALVDYANDAGGVFGKTIDVSIVKPDFVRADQQRQKCIELTEWYGVFAVIDSIALGAPTSAACVTEEHDTLLLNGVPGSDENFRLGAPHHVSLHKDDNRSMKDLVAAAMANG
ncbi:MAG TPA: hypothetical protein VMZ22_07095, partial [Acidimicrobiales bacterium]|nr:hypothetical protein [Acidimicrobiales bacterium]